MNIGIIRTASQKLTRLNLQVYVLYEGMDDG